MKFDGSQSCQGLRSPIRDTNEAAELATSLGRTPTQAELAKFMGKDVSEYQKERSTPIR